MEEALSRGPSEATLARCHALLLDVSFKAIDVLTWQRAVTLALFGKVDVLEYYDVAVRRCAHCARLRRGRGSGAGVWRRVP